MENTAPKDDEAVPLPAYAHPVRENIDAYTADQLRAYGDAREAAALGRPAIDVDALAQEIRRVDGSHSLGAGVLAEALMPFLGRARLAAQQPNDAEIASLRVRYGITANARGIKEFDQVASYTRAVLARWGAPPTHAQVDAAPQLTEHYDEVKATLQGLHGLMESLCSPEIYRRLGPAASHARGYTHKITNALRHLDALDAPHDSAADVLAVADFLAGAKDRLGRPDASADDAMRDARERVKRAAVRHGVQGGHHTYLDQCAAVLRASVKDAK